MNAILRLFKALPIKKKYDKTKKLSSDVYASSTLKQTIAKGFIFSPDVLANYTVTVLPGLIDIVEEEVGLSADKMNNAFHKSWNKIKTASIEQLVLEQIVHYFTTYGFQALGVYDKDSVYIPTEKLDIPKINEKQIKLIVIKGYTDVEIRTKLLKLLQSGIALNERTIKDVVEVGQYLKLSIEEVETIKNKEVKIIFYDFLNIVPKNPVEFLRYIIFKTIGKTLLIKNMGSFVAIKEADKKDIYPLFLKYQTKYGFKNLATIFYRFKPLFLAFKNGPNLNTVVNKIRKLAYKYHKPMPEDYLNSVTAKIKNDIKINKAELEKELDKVNVFRKIRLAYALKYRTKDVKSILYKIRNGKGFATEFSFDNKSQAEGVLKIVNGSILEHINKNVKGKKIYIPDNIVYALPATEKQFTEGFPAGSCVKTPKDMVVGVHWENNNRSIDLDLSLTSLDGKYGWDAAYRSEGGDILFSGDLTDAPKPKGASEFFYVKRQVNKAYLLNLNFYNHCSTDEVLPFKIIIAQEQVSNIGKDYMVDPNKVITVVKTSINQHHKILGLLVVTTNECRFYISEICMSNSVTASHKAYSEHARRYLIDSNQHTISLNSLLSKSQAKLTDEKSCDINLSTEQLEKDSIIKLIS